MNDLRTAAQQVLEALERDELDMVQDSEGHMVFRKEQSITALRAALEQPEQEPVAEWLTGCPGCGMDGGCDCDEGTCNPPRREWRGLTDEEQLQILDDTMEGGDLMDIARAIEAALRSKNHE